MNDRRKFVIVMGGSSLGSAMSEKLSCMNHKVEIVSKYTAPQQPKKISPIEFKITANNVFDYSVELKTEHVPFYKGINKKGGNKNNRNKW